VYEWVKLFGEWSKSLEEITLRLSTRKGIPEIDIPVTSCHPESLRTPPPLKRKPPVKLPTEEEEEEVILPLRTVLWKHFFFKPSSAFARFFPPGVTNTATRRVFYQNLHKTGPSSDHAASIEKDLRRSSPSSDYAQYLDDQKLYELRRVLQAYATCDRELGYCQGLNFIVFMLLIHLDEVDSFWGLFLLLKGFNLRDLFLVSSSMLQDFLDMLNDEMRHRFPRLMEHLEQEGIMVSMYAMEWLTTFFVYNFPLDTARRIWDIMLLRGYKGGIGSLSWIYQVSMAIVEICHDQLMQWDIDDIMTSMRKMTTSINPNVLLSRAVDFFPSEALRAKLQLFAGPRNQNCTIS